MLATSPSGEVISPASDRPVIYGGGGLKIFETSVIETSAAANKVGLTLVDHPIVGSAIGFDFLDPGDGAVFSVVHRGNKLTDIRLNGEIIGGRIWRTIAHGENPPKAAVNGGSASVLGKDLKRVDAFSCA